MKIKQFVLDTGTQFNTTPWCALDWRQNPFSVSFQVDIAGSTGTYTVQYGYSDLIPKKVTISNSTTTATVTYPNHGLKTGDSVIISGARWADYSTATNLNGTYQVTRVDANTFTYVHTTDANTATAPDASTAIFIKVMDHDSVAAKTTSEDGNLAFGVQFVRCWCTVAGAGKYLFTVTQGSN